MINPIKKKIVTADNSAGFFTKGKNVFLLSIFSFVFWFMAHAINVYQNSIVGAVFEMLWVFMVVLMFLLPVISVYFWVKEKLRLNTFYFYSLLINILSFVILGIQSKR